MLLPNAAEKTNNFSAEISPLYKLEPTICLDGLLLSPMSQVEPTTI